MKFHILLTGVPVARARADKGQSSLIIEFEPQLGVGLNTSSAVRKGPAFATAMSRAGPRLVVSSHKPNLTRLELTREREQHRSTRQRDNVIIVDAVIPIGVVEILDVGL